MTSQERKEAIQKGKNALTNQVYSANSGDRQIADGDALYVMPITFIHMYVNMIDRETGHKPSQPLLL